MKLHPAATCICLLLFILAASSCGFKLRTIAIFPKQLEPLYISGIDRFDDIEQAISVSLDIYNIQKGKYANSRSRLEILRERKIIQDTLVQETNTKQLTLLWEYRLDVFNSKSGKWERRVFKKSISESKDFNISGSATESNPEFRDLLFELREELADRVIRLLVKTI